MLGPLNAGDLHNHYDPGERPEVENIVVYFPATKKEQSSQFSSHLPINLKASHSGSYHFPVLILFSAWIPTGGHFKIGQFPLNFQALKNKKFCFRMGFFH